MGLSFRPTRWIRHRPPPLCMFSEGSIGRLSHADDECPQSRTPVSLPPAQPEGRRAGVRGGAGAAPRKSSAVPKGKLSPGAKCYKKETEGGGSPGQPGGRGAMKKLLAVVALAGLILIVWNWRSEGGGATRREQPRPTPAPTSAPAAPIMPAGAANAQTPRPAPPPPAPPPAAPRDPSPALMAAARQTGVQIVRYEEQSPGSTGRGTWRQSEGIFSARRWRPM
ncbi:MAG: hypothetical protein BWZ08_01144 [candidate division BRC1 bacterium ADurb.BinA292]|nr:MAG: hypothetical protein BWZ08_01144 [candidate division BRC1 bacterium ADurb.BinA292]